MKVKIKNTKSRGICDNSSRYWRLVKRQSSKRIRQEMRLVCMGIKEEADAAKWCGEYHD